MAPPQSEKKSNDAAAAALLIKVMRLLAAALGRAAVRAALVTGAFFLSWQAVAAPEVARIVASALFDLFVLAALMMI